VPTRKPIILCVDDQESGLIARKLLLEAEGYEILTASDGRSGLQAFISQPVDAVILDYQMPEVNGDEVASQMKQAKPEIPILLLSGYARLPDNKLNAVDVFLSKSEPVAIFLASVQQVLTKSSVFSRWLSRWKSRISSRNRAA
jgi:CheY-like chemotaxis protein